MFGLGLLPSRLLTSLTAAAECPRCVTDGTIGMTETEVTVFIADNGELIVVEVTDTKLDDARVTTCLTTFPSLTIGFENNILPPCFVISTVPCCGDTILETAL